MNRFAAFHTSVQDVEVPSLGLGTFQLRGSVAIRAVEHALALGYRHIDTAAMYGNQNEVGVGFRNSSVDRGDVFVTTKVWRDSLTRAGVRASAENSLTELDVDYIDLLLIHWPNPAVALEETLSEMTELVHEEKVRHIGVSNFSVKWLHRAIQLAPIFCNQIEYHPLLGQRQIIQLAREADVLITAYSPLAQGVALKHKALRLIARKHRKSTAQVVLRWLIQQDHVCAIPRSADARHRASNFDIWDFMLDAADMEAIAQLDRQQRMVRPAWAIFDE